MMLNPVDIEICVTLFEQGDIQPMLDILDGYSSRVHHYRAGYSIAILYGRTNDFNMDDIYAVRFLLNGEMEVVIISSGGQFHFAYWSGGDQSGKEEAIVQTLLHTGNNLGNLWDHPTGGSFRGS